MGAVVSGWGGRLSDAIVERLSRLFATPTDPARLFPEATRSIFDQPDALEVLALDPADHQNGDPPDRFHGYLVLGRVAVVATAERVRIGRALIAGNARTRSAFKCFDPYIGVRADRGGRVVSLAACFWCGNAEAVGPAGARGMFPMSGWPARLLSRHLAAAGGALARPPA